MARRFPRARFVSAAALALALAVVVPAGSGSPSTVLGTATLTTQASPPVTVGSPIFDTATVSGGVSPTGTITFTLFGPDNPVCVGAPIFTSTPVPVAGNGPYVSGSFVPTTPGTYRWVADYSGDANNAPVTTACNDPAESVVVTAATAVTLRSLGATRVPSGVLIRWRTASEADTLGFYVYRQVKDKRVGVNTRLIATNQRRSYSFLDRKALNGKTVRYWIQVVNLDGSRQWYGPVRIRSST